MHKVSILCIMCVLRSTISTWKVHVCSLGINLCCLHICMYFRDVWCKGLGPECENMKRGFKVGQNANWTK